MKNVVITLLLITITHQSFSNAVCIINSETKQVLQLKSSRVNVSVVNQVATVVSTQEFYNPFDTAVFIKYAFPLYEDAAAVGLRWYINGMWHSASFAPEPQDTTLPGGGGNGYPDPNLIAYLGATPLYFELGNAVAAHSNVTFELTYVQLLHYAFNTVDFTHPNDYSLIQSTPLDSQSLVIHIYSDRSITGIDMLSHTPQSISYSLNDADANVLITGAVANKDYELQYTLDSTQLGLFSFSTFLPDSMAVCDEYGNGFFAFIVEPDPNDSVILKKVFTLIIDKSGSMSGTKISQAKDAATFVVNNLNTGDKFNIIDFDESVSSEFANHVDVNITNQNAALNYINNIQAGGSTNISGSFDMAIPQFSNSDPDDANIIIFMTDGQPTAGITTTDGILNDIQNEINLNSVQGLSINSFGIGSDVNQSLLSQIASENNGLCQFFSNGDLLQVISDFYLSIQSPVLLNTNMSFAPPLVSETYPSPLPNLYKGHQLVVVGRYQQPGTVQVQFTGLKYGDTVTYNYSFVLTDSMVEQNLFLTKLWAIQKINNLMTQYYAAPDQNTANDIQSNVIGLSECYSVMSPFTSFAQGGGSSVGVEEVNQQSEIVRATAFPNPFRENTTIKFSIDVDSHKLIPCIITDVTGKTIRVLSIWIGTRGSYEILWDGKNDNGASVPAGTYFYSIKLEGETLNGAVQKY